MAESNELQALQKMTVEVDEAQCKVLLATECINGQTFLVSEMKEQLERNKETIGFIRHANWKLQSEITQAEREINSFSIAKKTIEMANIELKKELFIVKDRKIEVIERVKNGEKKYEELWLEAKSRYESLPHVQNLLKAKAKAQNIKDQIETLDKQTESLKKEFQTKKEACETSDRKRVVELAEFVIRDRPKMILIINEKSQEIANLTSKLKNLDVNSIADNEKAVEQVTAPKSISKIDESGFVMPKLQLGAMDIDDWISVNVEQVKKKITNYNSGQQNKPRCFDMHTSIIHRRAGTEESISIYFSKPIAMNEKKNYSSKKLINILEDLEIDANDAMDMVSKVNPDTLQPVQFISSEVHQPENPGVSNNKAKKVTEPIYSQEIEEIDTASSNVEDIVIPPTQFLDVTLNTQKSQKNKKTVSFNLSIASQNETTSGNTKTENVDGTINSQLNISAGDDEYSKIKDMVLKKQNLDVTPPFVYSKNTVLQKKTEEKVVTSKFFRGNENIDDAIQQQENAAQAQLNKLENKTTHSPKENLSKIIEMDAEEGAVAKKSKMSDELDKIDKAFSGYHRPQVLADSLDLSINTTANEDGDEFQHCIDPSLLLSPKADMPIGPENPAVQSQEVPNFLSGLRKTGLSFFGLPSGDDKPGTSNPNPGGSTGFNFNFGSEEKKTRGGLFSMFQ